METKTDNELIAEFMGYKYYAWNDLNRCGAAGWKSNPNSMEKLRGYLCRTTKELSYHTSWDWLMPVVQKIRLLLNDNELYEKSKERKFWDIIMLSFQAVSIESTYIPVVEFIKWYNKEKSNLKSKHIDTNFKPQTKKQ